MKAFLFGILLSLLSIPASYAVYKLNPESHKRYKLIQSTLCAKDTAKAIEQLLQFEQDFPTDWNILVTNKTLGDLLLLRGKPDVAIRALKYALSYQPDDGVIWSSDSTECDKVMGRFSFSSSKADICVSLSKAYLSKQTFDSSLYYLQLADGKYLPYRDCGNGVLMYKSYLSSHFAQHYLAAGDTTQAINRLLDFFMEPDGSMKRLSALLKNILLMQYTPLQIRQEIKNGIATLRIVPGTKNEPERVIVLTLFNHNIRKNAYDEPLAYWKEQLAQHRSILRLVN